MRGKILNVFGCIGLLVLSACGGGGGGSAPAASTASAPATTPVSVTVPGAPTGVSAVAGQGQATVSFTAPASNGGATITSYTVTSSPGNIAVSGAVSPLTVTGLTNGTAYTFTVKANNSAGASSASTVSNSVTPLAATKPISGAAYIRDSNIAFASNASGVGIANTTVTIVGASGFTGGDGNFTVNAPLAALATDKVTLTNASYIPISIDRSLVDINPSYTNIGMYPIQTVQKKTGFITGVFTMDAGGFMPEVFSSNKFPPTYDRIVSSTSANSDFGFLPRQRGASVIPSMYIMASSFRISMDAALRSALASSVASPCL